MIDSSRLRALTMMSPLSTKAPEFSAFCATRHNFREAGCRNGSQKNDFVLNGSPLKSC